MTRTYRICSRCIMDTSDPAITFLDGVCNHCRSYQQAARQAPTAADRAARLERLVADLKQRGRGKPYDCVIGVSGGVDSTYVAYLVRQWGLRPLAVHLDNGWDSELAVRNIQRTLQRLDIELHTVVLDWEEFRDLQIAFLRASVPDGEIPTDHAIVATLFQVAARHKVDILHGCNTATEAVLPTDWAYGHGDTRYIHAVHKTYGTLPLRSFPFLSRNKRLYDEFIRNVRYIPLLDYVDYNKSEAMDIIQRELGWQDYGGKHYESVYTRFFQGYILPRKFGIDKRRAHLSNLICSGQLSRPEALHEMDEPPLPADVQDEDYTYLLKKFGFTREEFEAIMHEAPRSFREFPTYQTPGRWEPLRHALLAGAKIAYHVAQGSARRRAAAAT